MENFKCHKCHRELPLTTQYFAKNKTTKTGFYYTCKECYGFHFRTMPQPGFRICRKCGKELPETVEFFHKSGKGFHQPCAECRCIKTKNPYKEKRIKTIKVPHIPKPPSTPKNPLSPRNIRYRNDVQFNLYRKASSYVNAHVRKLGIKKPDRTIKYLGISWNEYKIYLENLFTTGMTWKKFMTGEIWIDHTPPLAYYDWQDDQQLYEAFHYSHTKPMWKKENISKSSVYKGVRYRVKKPSPKVLF